ncbi:MAG: hypothetical protein J6B09_02225 [Clostridia bacterium]|nr:hypothetical protein [Clostridia bacterium]
MELTEKDKRALRSSKLLRTCTEKKFLWSTIEAIGEVLGPTKDDPIQHDRLVIKLLELVENSETEEEVLKKLETL